ncbi:MAG: peptidase U32 family protein [bacterium]|jgi:putative protease
MNGIPELLSPAGDLEKLKMALIYGADAVYCAGKAFGLRAGAGNLTEAELKEGVLFAHQRGKKVYVTVNIIPHNEDLEDLPAYLCFLGELGVDGLIVADPGVISIAQETVPHLPLALSTQASAVNWRSVQFWQRQGIKRIILARELSYQEIAAIKEKTDIELEAFVHGAMCMAYSGRCLLSMYLTGRDANRGDCAQPCRWGYNVVEEKRPGEYFPLEEDERGAYIFNSKDLCLIEYIPQLVELGLASLKIEGRMKGIHYVATVTRVYRQALDTYKSDPEGYELHPQWLEELAKVSHRDYTTGFFLQSPTGDDHIYKSSKYRATHDFIGLVKEYDHKQGQALVEQRNPFAVGEKIEITGPGAETFSYLLADMYTEEGSRIANAPHPQQLVRISTPQPVKPYALVRRAKEG